MATCNENAAGAMQWLGSIKLLCLFESFVSSLHSRDQSQTTAPGEILFKIQNWVQVFCLQKYIHTFTVQNKTITFFLLLKHAHDFGLTLNFGGYLK